MLHPNPCRPPRSRKAATALLLLFAVAGCQAKPRPDTLSLESRLRLAGTMDVAQGGAASVGVLREAAAQQPRDAALREQLAAAAERAGLYAEAAQAMREAVALQGPSLPRLLAIGRLELRVDNPAAAVQAFEEAGRLSPGSAAALGGLGLARDMSGDQGRAQEAYRAALALAPRDWAIRGNLALSLVLSGQARAATEILADAEYAPEAPRRARHNMALALTASGQSERAARLLRMDMGPAEAEVVTQELGQLARRLDPTAPQPATAGRATNEPPANRVARARPRVARQEVAAQPQPDPGAASRAQRLAAVP